MIPAFKASSQHIATIEDQRNKTIPAVRKDLSAVFAPVRQAIADGKDATAVHHAIAALTSQKESLALAVAKAYEDASAPMVSHQLLTLASIKAVPQAKIQPAVDAHITKYVAGILPDYVDRVLASFATQARALTDKQKARPSVGLSFTRTAPVVSSRGRHTYYAKATRGSTLRATKDSSSDDTTDDSEGAEDEEDTSGEFDVLDELDGLTDDALDTMSDMVSVTAGNLGMYAGADAWSDEAEIDLVKVWQAIEDNRTRPSHADADGQTQQMEDPFDVGDSQLAFPLDSSLGADIGEIIYCRCVVVFEPAYNTSARRRADRWVGTVIRALHDHGRTR